MVLERVRDLDVYQHAYSAAMSLFEQTRQWPRDERFAMTHQVRRSSRAVCANLAEAWAKRPYPRHFVSKLSDAQGEAEETLVWIDFATFCGYLDEATADALRERYRHVVGGLVKMIRQPASWCGPSRR